MTSSTYKKTHTVTFTHSFYKNNKLRDLLISPSISTKNIMRVQNILFRQGSNGFNLYIDTNNIRTADDQPTDRQPLVFSFSSTNPDFNNVTNIPLSLGELPSSVSGKAVYYCSDQNVEEQVDETQQAQLIKNIISLKPLMFSFSLPSDTTGSITINNNDNIILTPNYNEHQALQINLSDYGSGRYSIRNDNTVLLDFYADDNYYRQPPLGIIEVFEYGVPPKDLSNNDYNISFEAIETIWKYFIVNNSGNDYYNFSISGNNDMKFNTGKKITLMGDKQADVLIAAAPIALAEIPSEQFKLNITDGINSNAVVRTLIDPLPTAGHNTINAVQEEQKIVVYSEIFVYV